MSKTLTQEEFLTRLNNYTQDSVKLITPYINKNTKVLIECKICHNQWSFSPTSLAPNNMNKHKFQGCPKCKYVELTCPVCHKKFKRLKSNVYKNNYCSLSCAATANNKFIKENNSFAYRRNAFENYPHKCSICGWQEDERILEVHHLDENRNNNNLDNLTILCPNCHKFLTLHLYNYEELYKLKNN